MEERSTERGQLGTHDIIRQLSQPIAVMARRPERRRPSCYLAGIDIQCRAPACLAKSDRLGDKEVDDPTARPPRPWPTAGIPLPGTEASTHPL